MRSISKELVQYFVNLLEGIVISGYDAERLVELIEEREEFLGHLLLVRHSFDSYPDVLQAIDRLAVFPMSDSADWPAETQACRKMPEGEEMASIGDTGL